MSAAPRVVLDPRVVLSALLFVGGRLVPLRTAWRAARLRPLVSRETTAELVRVLAYPKFSLSAVERRELLGDYLPYCTTARIPPRTPRTPPCRDAGDVPFLPLALVTRAECLVTGDAGLLALAPRFAQPILASVRLLATLRE